MFLSFISSEFKKWFRDPMMTFMIFYPILFGLIDAATKEFGEKGYENASLNNILKEAGISKGTFYYHFNNKEELYMYLIEILIDEKKNYFAKNMTPDMLNTDIFNLLKILIKLGLEFANNSPNLSKFSIRFMKERDTEIYSKLSKKLNFERNDFLDNFIEHSYSKGELREDLPKEFVKRIISYLFMHIQDISDIIEVDDFEGAANTLIEFMKNGLECKS